MRLHRNIRRKALTDFPSVTQIENIIETESKGTDVGAEAFVRKYKDRGNAWFKELLWRLIKDGYDNLAYEIKQALRTMSYSGERPYEMYATLKNKLNGGRKIMLNRAYGRRLNRSSRILRSPLRIRSRAGLFRTSRSLVRRPLALSGTRRISRPVLRSSLYRERLAPVRRIPVRSGRVSSRIRIPVRRSRIGSSLPALYPVSRRSALRVRREDIEREKRVGRASLRRTPLRRSSSVVIGKRNL